MRRVALVRSILLLAVALAPLAAAAQEAAPPMPEDPRAPRYREVERGFFTGFEVGYLRLFKTPLADPAKYPYAPADGGASGGLVVGVDVGYDVTRWLAISAFVLGNESSANVSYGSFSLFGGGGDLRVSFPIWQDANGVDRLFLYAHGRGGYLVIRPEGLLGSESLYVAGGPGLEYFTHLRHFSVGLAVDYAYLDKASTGGVAVTPTVRYTF